MMSVVAFRISPIAGVLIVCFILTGCVNLVPVPQTLGEKKEATSLARLLKGLAPNSAEQLTQEHKVAQELKVTLEERANLANDVFKQRFSSYLDRLISIRDKRQQIAATLSQAPFNNSMVFALQNEAVGQIEHQIARLQSWIELCQSVKLRAELGQTKDFPEFSQLSHQLDTYLGENGEDAIANHLDALYKEFRLSEAEVGS